MGEIDIFSKMSAIDSTSKATLVYGEDSEQARKIAAHRAWLLNIRHERPKTSTHHKVGVYIRYFNQTKYSNYLSYHKKQFADTIALCPNWELVDFYVDEGNVAPNMESAVAWSRLLNDCFEGKVDLIITQKVSNVTRKDYEVTLCARLLATQKHPVGIYFISEDLYTLASYYQEDMKDPFFFPSPDWKLLPDEDNESEMRSELHE